MVVTADPAPGGGSIISPRWHWTREQFLRLADTGFFADAQDAELIRGEIYALSPPGPFHSGTVNPVADMLRAAFGIGFYVRTEQPLITSDEDSQPQPDIAVCVGTSADFRRRFPQASEARLVVEVSDSTLEKDRGIKLTDYAASNIPEYWIINLRESCVEVYGDPDSARGVYAATHVYRIGETIAPQHAPAGASLAVADLLGVPG